MAKEQIGVIGLGKFGFKFGQTLMNLGQEVLGIDSDPEKIKLAQDTFTQVYEADATIKAALEQIGLEDFSHVLVSVGDDIAASTMISMYLKELGIPKVWVKATNTDHEKLLHKVGADEVIIPEHLAANQLANRIAKPGFIEYLPFDKNMVLEEFTVDKWDGKKLKEIDLTNRYNVQIIAIKRAEETLFAFIPKADDVLQAGDTIVVIGPTEQMERLSP